MHGLDWYDYSSRMYDGVLGRFMSMDPMGEKYYGWSSYGYCLNNPVNNIDLKGDSVTVLSIGLTQHIALLVQNEAGKWTYYSVNGNNVYVSGSFQGGREWDDLDVGEFDSPRQFLDSKYNRKPLNLEEKRKNREINGYNFKEGFIIPATAEQDKMIIDKFKDIVKNEPYSLGLTSMPNHCGTTVVRSLNAAGIKTDRSLPLPYPGPLGGPPIRYRANSYFPVISSKKYALTISRDA